jgi:hypothetical protein
MLGFTNKRPGDDRRSELKQRPELHLMRYCSFPWIKRPRCETDNSAPSTAAAGKEWSHAFALPYVFRACTGTTSHRECCYGSCAVMPDRWLKSACIRKFLRQARSVKVSRGLTRTPGNCSVGTLCPPPHTALRPTAANPILTPNSSPNSDLRNFFLQYFTLPSTYIYQDKREQRGNIQKSIFCFSVITATCVCGCVCVTTPPPPLQRNFCLLIVPQSIEKPQKRKTDTFKWLIQNTGMKKAIDGLWA